MTISAKLAYQYTNTISFNCSTTSNHLHPLQVKNCDSNSRLVVDEDDNGKFRLEIVRWVKIFFGACIVYSTRQAEQVHFGYDTYWRVLEQQRFFAAARNNANPR